MDNYERSIINALLDYSDPALLERERVYFKLNIKNKKKKEYIQIDKEEYDKIPIRKGLKRTSLSYFYGYYPISNRKANFLNYIYENNFSIDDDNGLSILINDEGYKLPFEVIITKKGKRKIIDANIKTLEELSDYDQLTLFPEDKIVEVNTLLAMGRSKASYTEAYKHIRRAIFNLYKSIPLPEANNETGIALYFEINGRVHKRIFNVINSIKAKINPTNREVYALATAAHIRDMIFEKSFKDYFVDKIGIKILDNIMDEDANPRRK